MRISHVVVPVAVAEDVAVRPAEPDAVEELVCVAVMLREGEAGAGLEQGTLLPRLRAAPQTEAAL